MKKIEVNAKAVIFDMDGVITNTMPEHYLAWKKVFYRRGIKISKFDVYCREGQRGITGVREIFSKYSKNPVSDSVLRAILKEKEETFKKILKRRFVRGSCDFLKYLCRSGFKLALVTGTSRHEVHKILPKSIYDLFSVIITGSDVRFGKPHPEPFRKALTKLAVDKNEAIVIENAPYGIESAQRAGLFCIAIETSLPKSFLKKADLIFPSISVLRNRLSLKIPQTPNQAVNHHKP
ncbi:MAG: HAD family phosphatase [Candidatus Omnitrophica bacterium]|nr:HAD family phosphatase [Candidatus Omnitrophota bacterium]